MHRYWCSTLYDTRQQHTQKSCRLEDCDLWPHESGSRCFLRTANATCQAICDPCGGHIWGEAVEACQFPCQLSMVEDRKSLSSGYSVRRRMDSASRCCCTKCACAASVTFDSQEAGCPDQRSVVTHVSDIGDCPGVCLDSGGLNLIGSRLLILSKNSDVCLAGVSGIMR